MSVTAVIYIFNTVLFVVSTVALTVIFYEKLDSIKEFKMVFIFLGLIILFVSLYTII